MITVTGTVFETWHMMRLKSTIHGQQQNNEMEKASPSALTIKAKPGDVELVEMTIMLGAWHWYWAEFREERRMSCKGHGANQHRHVHCKKVSYTRILICATKAFSIVQRVNWVPKSLKIRWSISWLQKPGVTPTICRGVNVSDRTARQHHLQPCQKKCAMGVMIPASVVQSYLQYVLDISKVGQWRRAFVKKTHTNLGSQQKQQ